MIRWALLVSLLTSGGVLVGCADPTEVTKAPPELRSRDDQTDDEDARGASDEVTLEEDRGDRELPSGPSAPGTAPGAATGTSTQPPPTTQPAQAKPSSATAKVDATTLTVVSIGVGTKMMGFKVTGPGVPEGSDFMLDGTRLGKGCEPGAGWLTFRPLGGKQYMPEAGDDCGLVIEELPTAVGGRFRGRFTGTLHAINTTPAITKKVTLVFDGLRVK